MKRKVIALLLTGIMATSMLTACGGGKSDGGSADSGSSEGGSTAGATELTPEEQEAVDAGIIQLDGTLPIIKDPEAFEEKYGKITMLLVNSPDRVVEPAELEACKQWEEDRKSVV